VQTSGVNVREVGSKTSIDLIWFAGRKKKTQEMELQWWNRQYKKVSKMTHKVS
jgi:hypothetical protein